MENFGPVRFMNKTSFLCFFCVPVASQAFGLKQPYWQKRLVMPVKLPEQNKKAPKTLSRTT